MTRTKSSAHSTNYEGTHALQAIARFVTHTNRGTHSDDYDLGANEVLLLNKTDGTIIKLDKTHSRKSQVPINDADFELEFVEIFKLKWELLETGFWDGLQLPDEDQEDKL